jgi:hypothetical protein
MNLLFLMPTRAGITSEIDRTRSAADLRKRAETTHAHLEQIVLLGFGRESAAKEWLERQAGAKRRA